MTSRSLAAVDLNLLVALDALLQERSVTAAGRRLSLTQSTMSGALARLREVFEDELLVRAGQHMQPTPLAETLEEPLREALARLEQTVLSRGSFDPETDVRTFTLLASDYAALVIARPLVTALAAEAPQMQLRLDSASALEHGSLLDRGEVDLAIVPSRYSAETDLPSEPLFTDRFIGAAWAGNDEVGERIGFDDLERLPYVSYAIHSLPSMVDKCLAEHGHPIRPAAIAENFVTGALLLRGTSCVTFLQRRLVDELREPAALKTFEAPVELPVLDETMTWHSRSTNEPGHRWLRRRVAELAASLS